MVKQINFQAEKFIVLAIILLSLAVVPPAAEAQTIKYWIGGDGRWLTSAKWVGGTLPVSGDKVVLNTYGNVIYTTNLSLAGLEIVPTGTNTSMNLYHSSGSLSLLDTNSLIVNAAPGSYASYILYNTGSLSLTGSGIIGTGGEGEFYHLNGTNTVGADLILGRDTSGYGYYQLEGGTLDVTGNSMIGQNGVGQFYQDGGEHRVGKDLILANYANLASEKSVGYYEMWGGALNVTGNSIIGASGFSGWFDHYAGTHTTANLILGRDDGSWGRYELKADTLTIKGSTFIGQTGDGEFDQAGGEHAVTRYLYLGYSASGAGSYTLSDGVLSAGSEYIGNSGTGTFNQSGGTNTITNSLILGRYSGSTAVYTLESGSISAGSEYIGFYGSGSFTQSGGTNTLTNNLSLGQYAGASGVYTLSGGTLDVKGNIAGGAGSNTLNIDGGELTNNWLSINLGMFNIGHGAETIGSFSMDGKSVTAQDLVVGVYGSGTFTQSGGTNTVTGNLSLGQYAGASGVYALSGGTLDVKGNIAGGAGSSTLNIDGGTILNNWLSINLGMFNIGNSAGTNGTFSMDGKTVAAQNLAVGVYGSGTFTQSGGTNTVTNNLSLGQYAGASGVYTLSGGTLDVNGNIVGGAGSSTLNIDGGELTNNWLSINLGMFNIGNGAGTIGSFSMDGKSVTAQDLAIGVYGSGTFTQSGGTNTVTNNLTLGQYAGASGTYQLNSTGNLSLTGSGIIGAGGSGEFYHLNGTNTVGADLILGRDIDGYGYYQLEGGTLDVTGNSMIGQNGVGQFYQDGGEHRVGKDLILANNANLASEKSVGYYEMWGGALNVTGNSIIGASGFSGWFDHYAGTHTTANLILGRDDGSWGRYELKADTLTIKGSTFIGQSGDGEFDQAGGEHAISKYLYLGYSASGAGSYTLSDGKLSAGSEYIGNYGSGTFAQTGGKNTASILYLGSGSSGRGTYDLDGTGTLQAALQYIGYSGVGAFNQNSTTNNTSTYLYLGYIATGQGSYTLGESGSLSASAQYIGFRGSGVFNQEGGANTVTGRVTIAYAPATASGTYNLSGGTLSATSIVNNDQFNYSGGTLNADIINNATGTVTLSGAGTRNVNGDVTNDGRFVVTATGARYSGFFENNGAYVSTLSSNTFASMFVGPDGYLVGGDGDLFFFGNDFMNYSVSDLWNTNMADLSFADSNPHEFYLGMAGQSIFWDDLTLSGIIHLSGDAYLYADDISGLDFNSFTFDGNGRIYFDALDSANAYLLGYTGGRNYLAASYPSEPGGEPGGVPEPMTVFLLVLGFAGLAGLRKVRQKSNPES